CECGESTGTWLPVRGHVLLFRLLGITFESAEGINLLVPLCRPCKRGIFRVYLRTLLRTILLCLIPPVLLGLVFALACGEPGYFFAGLFVGFFTALIGWGIGHVRGRRRSRPVRAERYSPESGTVALWFRNPSYGEALLESLNRREEIDGH